MFRKTNIIAYLAENPTRLFLIDSLGALLTAFLLFVLFLAGLPSAVQNFDAYFGMPGTILACLSAIAACFCLYSAICFFLKAKQAPFIRAIAIANLLYCMVTMVLIGIYYPLLTAFDMLYFILEIIILFALVYVELKVAAAMQ